MHASHVNAQARDALRFPHLRPAQARLCLWQRCRRRCLTIWLHLQCGLRGRRRRRHGRGRYVGHSPCRSTSRRSGSSSSSSWGWGVGCGCRGAGGHTANCFRNFCSVQALPFEERALGGFGRPLNLVAVGGRQRGDQPAQESQLQGCSNISRARIARMMGKYATNVARHPSCQKMLLRQQQAPRTQGRT